MLWVSFVANLLVLLPPLWALWRDTPGAAVVLGPDTPARRLLACLWLTVACASAAALVQPHKAAEIAHTLLPLQVLFTLFSLPALGLRHPATRLGAGLAVLHVVTMVSLYAGFGP